jgi:hypothetical protein
VERPAARADQQVRRRAHRARDQHRLADVSQVGGRSSAPGGSARVAPLRCTHSRDAAVDGVVLELGQVVRHVVDQHQVARAQRGSEGVAHRLGEQLPVGTPVVGRCGHRPEVRPPLRRVDRHAGQLASGPDAVPGHRVRHDPDVVLTDLVAEPTRAGVDHHAHLPGPEPEAGGDVRVVEVVDDLDLDEVVARSEAADLAEPRADAPGR